MRVIDGGAAEPPRRPGGPKPLLVIDPCGWRDVAVPARRWVVQDCVIRGGVTMLSGDGGLGKSLLMQQLATACAVGKPWLGLDTQPLKSLCVFCEDDEGELHRRQAQINEHYEAGWDDLSDMKMISRVGDDNILMEFDRRTDIGKPTEFYRQLLGFIRDFGAQLVVIDTIADTFGGNENFRTQVRQFVNALRRIAMDVDGAVVVTAHPSLAGLNTGSGISGSTAWNNSVRGRMYLTKPKPKFADGDEEDEGDPNERLLKTMKSNYGANGGSIKLVWKHGIFAPTGSGAITGAVDRIELDLDVMSALRQLITSGTKVSADKFSRTYIVKAIQQAGYCRAFRRHDIELAKERMIGNGKIVRVEIGPPSKRLVYLVPAEQAQEGQLL